MKYILHEAGEKKMENRNKDKKVLRLLNIYCSLLLALLNLVVLPLLASSVLFVLFTFPCGAASGYLI